MRQTVLSVGYQRVHSSGAIFALAKFYGSLAHCQSLISNPRQLARWNNRRTPEPVMDGHVATLIERGEYTLYSEV